MPIGVQILEGKTINLGIRMKQFGSPLGGWLDNNQMMKGNQSLMPIWAPMTIGSVFLIGGMFLSSFVMSNSILFSIFHGVFFGIGYGLCYMAPIIAAYKFFPRKQGFVNGIIMTGFSFGSLLYLGIIAIYVWRWNNPILLINGGFIFNM